MAPPSVEVAHPMAAAPPVVVRPTWNAATTVFPNEKLSGSTAVACCPGVPLSGSWKIGRAPIAACAGSTASASRSTASEKARRTTQP